MKTWWTMEDLMQTTSKSRKWLKDNILQIPRHKQEIEKFAHYPIHNNDEYRFIASKMKNYLEEHFHEFFN